MTPLNRLKALLKKGYFPEGLPPPFKTDGLSQGCGFLMGAWDEKSPPKPTRYQRYSIPKAGGHRRHYAITNPVAQFYLDRLIATEWDAIKQYTDRSIFALDKINFTSDKARSITLTNFVALKRRKLKISSCHDFILNMDISRFYPTLYTHTIPWALHDKEWCKAQNFKSPGYQNTLGNKLDWFVRLTQENQTLGIPIGPDSSRILSEILAVAAELKFQAIINEQSMDGVRNYDDISIGIRDLSTAEKYQFAFSQALNFYELQLNQEKTKTIGSNKPIEKPWSSTLMGFTFGINKKSQLTSIDHFFSLAFDFAEHDHEDNVLNYAVKKTKGIKVFKENWEVYEAYLLKTARTNGTCISPMVQILTDYNDKEYKLDKEAIKKFIMDSINSHAPISHHSELAWSLYLAKALKIQLDGELLASLYKTNCSVCALLTLDLNQLGLIQGTLDTSYWESFLTGNNLHSEMWLLAYEADLKGWLAPKEKNFVDKDPYFKFLKQKKISFYDVKSKVASIRSLDATKSESKRTKAPSLGTTTTPNYAGAEDFDAPMEEEIDFTDDDGFYEY